MAGTEINRVSFSDLAKGLFFLSQNALGKLGNSTLLCCFSIDEFSRIRVRSTKLIVKHLTGDNFMDLLHKGIPQMMAALVRHIISISLHVSFYFIFIEFPE